MGGSSYNQPAAEPMSQVLQDYQNYLPGVIGSTAATIPDTAQQTLSAAQQTAGPYNALNLAQTQQYAVPLAQAGQAVTNSNALAGAQTNLNQIQGAGGQVANAALGLAQQTNPNYYNVQNPASAQAANLLGAYNTTGLSPGAANAAERSTNQSNTASGNLGLSNPTNTIANAENFGQYYNNQLSGLGTALGAAAGTATSAQNTGFNPVSLALGQPNASTMGNFGTGTYSATNPATQSNTANSALNFGSGLLGNMTSMNNTALSSGGAFQSANNVAQLANQGSGTTSL